VEQQHTSPVTPVLKLKSTYRSLTAPRLSEHTVETLLDLRNLRLSSFRLTQIKKRGNKLKQYNTFWAGAELQLAGVKVHSDEGGGRILLSDHAAANQFLLAKNSTLGRNFQDITVAYVGCVCVGGVSVCQNQACQTEGPPRAAWVTFVLSWGPHTTINWSHLIKNIAEYFYYLNLETYNVNTNILNKEKHAFFCERRAFIQFKL
jgi:hypothetical protein